ncbi:Flavin-containing amine oxidase [Neofusicoccum parvum]|nr:Flavin-containing amine oxidase [Neofusicoccum parvum]
MLDVIVVGAGLRYGHGYVELGAAWINETNQHRMYGHAKKFGLELFSTSEVSNLEGIRNQSIQFSLDRNADLTHLDEVTVEQYVKNRYAIPKTVKMVNL